MPTQEDPNSSGKPWIEHGWAEHEDFLIGNRRGLEVLRQGLDRALADGECKFEDPDFEIIGVRVVERNPRAGDELKRRGWKDAAALWGCGLVAFFSITTFLAGLYQIWSWMK